MNGCTFPMLQKELILKVFISQWQMQPVSQECCWVSFLYSCQASLSKIGNGHSAFPLLKNFSECWLNLFVILDKHSNKTQKMKWYHPVSLVKVQTWLSKWWMLAAFTDMHWIWVCNSNSIFEMFHWVQFKRMIPFRRNNCLNKSNLVQHLNSVRKNVMLNGTGIQWVHAMTFF